MSLGRMGSYKPSNDRACRMSDWYGGPSLQPCPGWSEPKTHSQRVSLLMTSLSWSTLDPIVWNLSPSVSGKRNFKDGVMSFHSGSLLRSESYLGDATGLLVSSAALWLLTTLELSGRHLQGSLKSGKPLRKETGTETSFHASGVVGIPGNSGNLLRASTRACGSSMPERPGDCRNSHGVRVDWHGKSRLMALGCILFKCM